MGGLLMSPMKPLGGVPKSATPRHSMPKRATSKQLTAKQLAQKVSAGPSSYIGRVGALAVALGIGAAITTWMPVAFADTTGTSDSSDSPSSSGGTSPDDAGSPGGAPSDHADSPDGAGPSDGESSSHDDTDTPSPKTRARAGQDHRKTALSRAPREVRAPVARSASTAAPEMKSAPEIGRAS